MHSRTIAEAAKLLQKKQLSPVDLLRECLDKIEQFNPSLNAFITVTADSALKEAQRAEREISSGNWCGPLHGIPIGLKDLIDTAGVKTTAASAMFRDRVPTEDSDVVKKLKSVGAVLIGKQNLHEFAYGGSSLISHFGPVRNPVNPEVIAGGSSGGSATAVALGMCYGAIGTDTAGSIREPAAFCGVVGLKPSNGLVSLKGIIPLSPSLDCAGPITRNVEDAAILLDAITGTNGAYQQAVSGGARSFVLGVPRNYFFEDLDPEVRDATDRAIAQLSTAVSEIREIDVPVPTDRSVQGYETYAYHREMIARSPELYDPETLRRVSSGEKITAADYQTALQQLKKTRAEVSELFREIDVLLTPTTPVPASNVSELMKDPALLRPAEMLMLRNTRPVNVWGLPAISVPCGFTSHGLPIGLQIMGPPNREEKILQTALRYQNAHS
jgi:aspartyl-tRNA(Asn)/glutamyl-tRNA(Gln) amidotransferase subunit A